MDKNKLTWKDIRKIVLIADNLLDDDFDEVKERYLTDEEYYTEILRIFNEKN